MARSLLPRSWSIARTKQRGLAAGFVHKSAVRRSLFRTAVVLAMLAGLVSPSSPGAAASTPSTTSQSAPDNLSGTWYMTDTWTTGGGVATDETVENQTRPGIYTVSHESDAGSITTDVPISRTSFYYWSCDNVGTYSQSNESACQSGYFDSFWHLDFSTNPYTATGKALGYNKEGALLASARFTAHFVPSTAADTTTTTTDETISGYVLNDCGCEVIGGVPILVKGMASDGTAVTETDKSADADGSWSVQVPPGRYTAGPTKDGSDFDLPAFDPEPTAPLTVTTSNVENVDFHTCAGDSSTSGSSDEANGSGGAGTSRQLGLTGGRRPLLTRTADGASNDVVSGCKSLYTLTVGTELPSGPIVDASRLARYATQPGNDYRGSNTYIGAFLETPPVSWFWATSNEYPECMDPTLIEHLNLTHVKVEWYSELYGESLGAATIKLLWDQSVNDPNVTVLGSPIVTQDDLVKVWHWSYEGERGTCSEQREVPVLAYPETDGTSFTVLLAWGIPFTGPGISEDVTPGLITRAWLKVIGLLPAVGKKIYNAAVKKWGTLTPAVREFIEICIIMATTKGLGTLVKMAPAAIEGLVGEKLTEAELAALVRWAGFAEIMEQVHTVGEWVAYLNGFGGSYPIPAEVIRGQFTTANGIEAEVGGKKRLIAGNTVLGLSTVATNFPTIKLQVQRRAYQEAATLLPWKGTARGDGDTPSVYNQFPSKPAYQVNIPAEAGQYASGQESSFKALWDDTTNLPWVSNTVSWYITLTPGEGEGGEDGAATNRGVPLGNNFKYEQAEAPAPKCSGTGGADALHADTNDTICWEFWDGKP
jgi:hypothetical protein